MSSKYIRLTKTRVERADDKRTRDFLFLKEISEEQIRKKVRRSAKSGAQETLIARLGLLSGEMREGKLRRHRECKLEITLLTLIQNIVEW